MFSQDDFCAEIHMKYFTLKLTQNFDTFSNKIRKKYDLDS